MSSILGRESDEIQRLADALDAVLERWREADSTEDLATTLIDLRRQIEGARERYWSRARELHKVREALKLSG